jgi:ABC-type uncharacterized transport system involved in gliding motility auxiliary subunit
MAIMKIDRRRLAPLGLAIALVAALAAILFALWYKQFNLQVQICIALIILGLGLFGLLDPERVRRMFTGRQAKYGSNTMLMSVFFIGILVVVNFLAYQNQKRWDLTQDKQFTLAKETVETLQRLPQPVVAQAFFANMSKDTAKGLLDQYSFNSRGKFSYKFIDPRQDPILANEMNITQDGSIVLTMGDRRETVANASEQDISGALVRLMSNKVTVYFLTGHGESSPDDTGDTSFSSLKSGLETKNYTVKTLNLLSENKIPADARAVIIGGPKKALTDDEVKILGAFLNNGGSVVLMYDSPFITGQENTPDPLVNYMGDSWGIVLGNNLVLDATSQYPEVAVQNKVNDHPITQQSKSVVSVFPTARSVTKGKDLQDVAVTELILTAPFPNSYAETNFQSLKDGNNQPDAKDLEGPVSVAASGENMTSKGRVVVFGDPDFATNAYYNTLGNGSLAINAIDWATAQENLINLTPKASTTRMMVPPTRIVMWAILIGSVFVIPALVLILGVFVWIQRRRRG